MRDRHNEHTQRELDRMVCDKKLHKIVGNLVLVEDAPMPFEFTLGEADEKWLESCGIAV
jgi:hypothetical protein